MALPPSKPPRLRHPPAARQRRSEAGALCAMRLRERTGVITPHTGESRETACPSPSVSSPGARCSRILRKPRARSRSGPCICGGRARPGPSPGGNIPPSKAALPAKASDSSRPRPNLPSRPGRVSHRSCSAGTRPLRPSLRRAVLDRPKEGGLAAGLHSGPDEIAHPGIVSWKRSSA